MAFATNDGVRLYYDVDGGDDPTGDGPDDSASDGPSSGDGDSHDDGDSDSLHDGPETNDSDGGRDTVVFVEGLAYGTWMWNRQRESLNDHFRTIAFDNRGTGRSDDPDGPYAVDSMAADLEAVLADADVEAAHVVGASLGGMIAQQYALDFDRASSLSLLCTTPGGDEAVPIPDETTDRMLNVPDEYDRRETVRYKMRPAFTDDFWEANPDVVDRIVDRRLETDPSPAAYEAQAAAAGAFDVSDRLDEIAVPTLVLHGTADRVVPVENAALLESGIPGAELVTFEGAPHLLFVERADDVTAEIRRFLADV